MTAPRRPADIAADLRKWAEVSGTLTLRYGLRDLADELDALDASWPTADEIADLRDVVAVAREDSAPGSYVNGIANDIDAFLDRLDPPQPEPQVDDDVDPWALVRELTETLESQSWDGRLIAVARAALDARGQR